jgi:hypothetical protein
VCGCLSDEGGNAGVKVAAAAALRYVTLSSS